MKTIKLIAIIIGLILLYKYFRRKAQLAQRNEPLQKNVTENSDTDIKTNAKPIGSEGPDPSPPRPDSGLISGGWYPGELKKTTPGRYSHNYLASY